MSDDFLNGLRAAPAPEFAARLRDRLREHDRAITHETARSRTWFVASAAIAAVAIALVAFPAVRASAQTFLNLFRVVDFAAVPVDMNRLNDLSRRGFNVPDLIGQQTQILTEPGSPQPYVNPGQAGAAAGIRVALPQAVPAGLTIVRIEVEGEHAARVTADIQKLQAVLDALGITDIRPPRELDGQAATIRVPPIVRVVYANGSREISLLQAKSPEIELPPNIDVATLGEIAFRIAGLGSRDAHTFAQAIDWRGTLVVPVPAGASAFRQVDVQGRRGLLVESSEPRDSKLVVWSREGVVYGITGVLNDEVMLQMANSVQ